MHCTFKLFLFNFVYFLILMITTLILLLNVSFNVLMFFVKQIVFVHKSTSQKLALLFPVMKNGWKQKLELSRRNSLNEMDFIKVLMM